MWFTFKKGWARGYFEAYKMLVTPESPIDDFDDFNRNAVILNVIKCSTTDASKLRGQRYEQAKRNCIHYLEKQLELIRPKVILAHGKIPCIEIMDMLKSESKYTPVRCCTSLSSSNINVLADEIKRPWSMDRILPKIKYITAKDKQGGEVLFLLNKHLSRWGPAQKSLTKNLPEKRERVKVALR